ncbi:MAG TPA: hypothetical protein VKQ30_10775 [Ktedonobacterales bacterium]|nr:hypothetical protein [Ktedonobacterales bacterium]
MLIRDQAEGNGRLRDAGASATNAPSARAGGWHGGNEGGIELAASRLVTDALAVAFGGIGQLLREGAACIVVVPQESSGYHVCPSSLG